ncbi:MAG: mannose-6-phosphate isomerase [Polyangiaceae bacterium]|nr:mannose-1-phosphate guanylyltransferase [Myxococcales bacterium]MCB9587051.1 mannose-6-phosphate isomerase [Polyangiaceae bacterium]MCB9610125.1 mannose-6-phosphate isomerase [Polyangiaceae bacterium]
MSNVYAVVMAGGSGTRFWPASRRLNPKQLLSIAPGTDESLIAGTVRRMARITSPDNILIATGKHLLGATKRQLPGIPEANFLGEPVAKNTAPCIGWATLVAARRDPKAIIVVVPSDQHVAKEAAFRAAVKLAIRSAKSGVITTIGIQPTRPETGYGYIELGKPSDLKDVHAVKRFVEKPDLKTANRYLKSGRYVWNAGMFIFRAADMLAEIEQHLPELHAGLTKIDDAARKSPGAEAAATRKFFAAVQSISIDYGVMERAQRLNVVPASFGWSDLGSWESSWELGARDADHNVAPGSAVLVDAKRNLIWDTRPRADNRVVALVGVEDLCVIQTDDALLVIPRERAQDVRAVVDRLKAGKRDKLV